MKSFVRETKKQTNKPTDNPFLKSIIFSILLFPGGIKTGILLI